MATLSQPAPFVLASMITSYPEKDLDECVRVLMADPDVVIPADLGNLILQRISTDSIEDLQSEYIDIFDHGRVANPIYETEYGRHRMMAKGNELSDIAGFYRAFGMELEAGRENMEMLDHVSIELEFYSLMLMKQIHLTEAGDFEGAQIVEDGRKKFLHSHLGRFVRAICQRPGVDGSDFYRAVFGWVADLVDQECKNLNLQVDQVSWVDGQQSKEEEMNCDIGGTCKK